MTKSQKLKGLTLIELLVTVGILIILAAIAIPNLRFFQKESDLNNVAEEIINTLRLAQNKTLASEGASQYGVHFDATSTPNQYILFKGTDYASRATSSDEIYKLPKTVEISEIDLWGGTEVVFERVTGYTSTTDQFGKISLELKNDPSKTKTIYIESSSQVGLTSPSTLSDENRIKDSRHIHLDYSRQIVTSTESLTLTFDTVLTKEIPFADYLKNGHFFWEDGVDVEGEIQKLKIHTHRLNNPDTQFSIHRDQRYNNKALTIDIDDTPTDSDPGTLITYTAQGETATGTSIYVSNLQWQ